MTLKKTKICTKCHLKKSIRKFSKRIASKDGLHSQCKICQKQYKLDNKTKIKQQTRLYYLKYRNKLLTYQKEYELKHPDYNKQWLLENPNYNKQYKLINKIKIKQQNKLRYLKHKKKLLTIKNTIEAS